MYKNLRTVRNYALMRKMTAANIYKLIDDEKIDFVIIDGVKFVVLSDKELNELEEG